MIISKHLLPLFILSTLSFNINAFEVTKDHRYGTNDPKIRLIEPTKEEIRKASMRAAEAAEAAAAARRLELKDKNTKPTNTFSFSLSQTIRKEAEENWNKLVNIHNLDRNLHKEHYTNIEVKILPNGNFDLVNVIKTSGNEKFDDIAILATIYTNPSKYVDLIPASQKKDVEHFTLMFKLNN